MTHAPGALRDLHRIHQQLRDLRDRMARGPRQIKAHRDNVARLTSGLEQAEEDAKSTKMRVDQKQLQLRSGEDKIRELENKLNSASTNREFQALQEQIAADRMAGSVLQDEILEALEKIDELDVAVREARQKVEKGQEELAKSERAISEQNELLERDVERLQKELQTAESELPKDLQDAYQRIVKSKGSDAMACVEDEVCGGCYQKVTPNMLNELCLNRPVFCKSCGRLLYPSESMIPGKRD